jgi:hypothetical protein
MADILDQDLGDPDAAYRTFVTRAPELIEAVTSWWRAKYDGNDPSIHDLHHVWWRLVAERQRWRTPRNMLESREPDSPPADSNSHPTGGETVADGPPSPGGGTTAGPRPPSSGRPIQVSNEPGIVNRGYAYWSQAWLAPDGVAYVFATRNEGPALFSVDLRTDAAAVRRLGQLAGYGGTGEGWYWDRDGGVTLLDGSRMRRVNPLTSEDAVLFDISDRFPGCRLWQAHSSEDGQSHSATVERMVTDGAYPRLGTVVWRGGELQWFPSPGALDESQIDKSGRYVVIKERDDNVIVTLGSDRTRVISDRDGALGHSDCGAGFVVGEDNISGACVQVDLRTLDRRELFRTWSMGHVSVRGDRCLVSNATSRALELIDLRDGSTRTLLSDIPGWEPGNYDTQVRANLSPCGRLAAFVSSMTGRNELYLLVV